MTTIYQHPDGHSIDFTDNALTTTTADGKAVSIPIGPYGLLLLGDKLESIAAGENREDAPGIPDRIKGNGPDSREVQPVKSLTNNATDFIAATARYATVNGGFNILFLVLVLQFVALVWGVL